MKKNLSIYMLATAAVTLLLSGCNQTKKTLGLGRETPDEFTVLDRPPLTVPPSIGLRPPLEKGEDSSSYTHDPKGEARRALFKKESRTTHERSQVEKMLLEQAHSEETDSGIRRIVNEEAKVKNGYNEFVQDLLFWQKKNKKGDVINPLEENKKYNNKERPGADD